eukprot:gene6097-11484_t
MSQLPQSTTQKVAVYHLSQSYNALKQETGCSSSLPQKDNKMCVMVREKYKMYNRAYYQLTSPAVPKDSERAKEIIFPTINKSTEDVLTRAMMDPFTSHWFNIYFYGMLKRNNETQAKAWSMFKHLKFDQISDFVTIYNFFMPLQEQVPLPYFKLPSMKPGFRNIVYNETWRTDKSFVEQRLAGLNPMALQKVTKDGKVGMGIEKLSSYLNKKFDWNAALSDALGEKETMQSAVEKGKLFVVDYPIYHDIPHVPDITDEDPTDRRVMLRSSSPVGLFAVRKDSTGKNELKAVAIQLDYKPESEVRTPKDGSKWMAAKGFLQMADFAVVEIYEHLLKTHVRIEPICVCIHRHLAPTHPLYQVLRIHCRGLLPTNSYGFPRLTNEFMYMHRLFGMGHLGTLQILNEGYKKMKWEDNDLLNDIKARGVDDPEILPYFPYRDDGKVIYQVIESFSRDLVDLFYKVDKDVVEDYEVQNLVSELSADGKGTVDAAKGRIVGFPAKLESREQLAGIIKAIVWLVIQHAAVNYPISAYGGFTPNMPTKLYEDPDHHKYGKYEAMLPKAPLAILQNFVTLNLGTMRYDRLFDYSESVDDAQTKLLLIRYYDQMTKEVQPMLEARNKKRYAEGQLTYPYMEPKWLPNSIHT